jgi:hypothetical protein
MKPLHASEAAYEGAVDKITITLGRLKAFDRATDRQKEREREASGAVERGGWMREQLYERRTR